MRHTIRNVVVGAAILLGAAACANLDVANTNQPGRARALATPSDVESLIAGAYNTYFNGSYWYSGPGLFLSNASFQHAAPWANAGMFVYGKIPRVPIVNNSADPYYSYFTWPWTYMYRAISSVSSGLRSIESDTAIANALGADTIRDEAYGNFMLGVAHASIAVLYDQGFVEDQTTDVSQPQTAVPYGQMMTAAMGYFNKALTYCADGTFTIPAEWVGSPTTEPMTNTLLAQVIHSYMARYMAAVARNPTERAAVDWAKVVSNVDAGITQDFTIDQDANAGWENDILGYTGYPGWQEMPYYIYGMADQGGNYQRWLAQSLTSREPNPGDGNIVIVTPDLRFPRGSTIAIQQDTAADGSRINNGTRFETMFGADAASVWKHPERGQWRWSWYKNMTSVGYIEAGWTGIVPEIPMVEMNLLKAEADYRSGNYAGAAALINVTRTAAGLSPATATQSGGNDTSAGGSCVPKLPDGTCGNLWEMLKWEKRMEIQYYGLYGAPWYFDSRGWGDLYAGTYLEFPAPCKELIELQMTPCYTFGGAGGDGAAPVSTYNFPAESG